MSTPLLAALIWHGLEFKEIDVVNAVIIAFLMALTVGIPLAIWTGVMLARWVAFDAAKMKAAEILNRIAHLVDSGDRDNYTYAVEQIVFDLLMVKAEMIRLRQVPGIHVLQFVSIRLQQHPWFPRQPDGKPDIPPFPLSDGMRQAILNRVQPYGMAWPKMIFDTGPSYWDLLVIRPRVTSRQTIAPCNFPETMREESAAINEIAQDMAAQERAREQLRQAQGRAGSPSN